MAATKVIEIPIIHPQLDPIERELFQQRQKNVTEQPSQSSISKKNLFEDEMSTTYTTIAITTPTDSNNETAVSTKTILSPNDIQYFSKPSKNLVAMTVQSIYDERSTNQSCWIRLPPIRWIRRLLFDYTDKQFLKRENITIDLLLQHETRLPALALVSSGIVTDYKELCEIGYSGGNDVLEILMLGVKDVTAEQHHQD